MPPWSHVANFICIGCEVTEDSLFRAAKQAELRGIAPQPLSLLDTAARAVALLLHERGPGTGGVDLQRLPPDLQRLVLRDIFTLGHYRRRGAHTSLPSSAELDAAWQTKREQLERCAVQRAGGATSAQAPLPSERDEALLRRWLEELATGHPLCALHLHEQMCADEFGRAPGDCEEYGPSGQCTHETGVWKTLERMMGELYTAMHGYRKGKQIWWEEVGSTTQHTGVPHVCVLRPRVGFSDGIAYGHAYLVLESEATPLQEWTSYYRPHEEMGQGKRVLRQPTAAERLLLVDGLRLLGLETVDSQEAQLLQVVVESFCG